jgi:hypothetical protein
MDKNFDYYADLAQKALDAGNKDDARFLMDQAKSLVAAPAAAPQAEAVDSESTGSVDITPTAPEEEGKGFLGAAAEVPTNISAGVGSLVREVGETIDWATDAILDWTGEPMSLDVDNASPEALRAWEDAGGINLYDAGGKQIKYISGQERQDFKAANLYSMLKLGDIAEDVLYTGVDAQAAGMQETLAGSMTHGVTQFLSGYALLGGVKTAQTAGYAAQASLAAVKGAAVDFTAFDAHEARASDMMIELGMEAEWLRYLAVDENDTVLEGKIKNAVEGMGLGVLAEGIFLGLRSTKSYVTAKRSADNQAKADELFTEASTLQKEMQEKTFKEPEDLADLDGTPVATVTDADAAIFKGDDKFYDLDEFVDTTQATKLDAKIADEIVDEGMPKKVELDERNAPVGAKLPDPEDSLQGAKGNEKLRNDAGDFRDLDGTGKRSKTISWADSNVKATRLIAKLMKGNGEDGTGIIQLAKQLHEYEFNVKDADQYAAAAIQMETFIWKQFEVLSATPAAKAGESASVRKLEVLAESLRYAQAARMGGASSNARALALQKQVKGVIPDLDFELSPEGMIRKLNSEANAGAIRKLGNVGNKLVNGLNEIWLNSLLSGWTTHAINLTSNAVVGVVDILEVAGGAGVAALKNPKEGARQLRLAKRQAVGVAKYAKISGIMAGKTLKTGRNILDEEGMVNEAVNNIVGDVAIGSGNIDIGRIFTDPSVSAIDRIGNIIRLPSRGLMGGDELFKQINFRAKAYSYAAEEIDKAIGAGKVSDVDFDALVEARVSQAYDIAQQSKKGDVVTDPIAAKSMKASRVNTFTNDLGESGKALQSFVGDVPLIRQVIPFIRTPINILKWPLRRSPLKLTQKSFYESIEKGGEEASQAIFQVAYGTALWGGAMGMVYNQYTEIPAGKGDVMKVQKWQGSWAGYTPYQKQALRASGASPNSYFADGEWNAYNRLDPFAMYIGVAADIRDVLESGEHDTVMESSTAAIIAIANQFKDKTYTKGLSDFIKAADDPERFAEQWFLQKAGSFVPSAVAQFKGDQEIREVRSLMDAVMNRLPVFSETLESTYDIFGQPNIRADGYIQKRTVWKDDVTRSEMFRLAPSIGKPSERHSSGVDLPDYKNADGLTAYARYNQLIGETEIRGRGVKDAMEKLILSKGYQQTLTDGGQSTDGKVDSSREKELKKIMKRYRDKAMGTLLKEYPELDKAIKEKEMLNKKGQSQRSNGQTEVFTRGQSQQKSVEQVTDLLNGLF